MMEKRGIGVIGCGNRMKNILRFLLKLNPQHKIIAIYDGRKESVEDYKKIFGENIKVYDNSKSLVSDACVEWIFIGSSNYAHGKYILEAFDANKYVFCEKPLVINLSECEEIKKLYEQKNLKFLISYPLRYSPHYSRIKKMIDEGKIGKIVSMEFNEVLKFNHGAFIMTDWRRFVKYSGGHLIEKCCHDIDLANWMVGSIAERVASFGGLNMFVPENSKILENLEKNGELGSYKKWKFNPFTSDKDIIDNQVGIIEYANGVRATFHTNCSSGLPERRMYICGTEGTIRADVLTGRIELKRIDSEKIIEIVDEKNKGGHGGGDPFLVEELNRVMLGGGVIGNPMNDAIKSAVTCLGIDEAMKNKKVVEMDSLWKEVGMN